MQRIMFHLCDACTYHTPFPYSAAVFSQNITCNHCGKVSAGVNVTGQAQEISELEHEDLANLLSQNLNLSNSESKPLPPSCILQRPQQSSTQVRERPQSLEISTATTYRASQHYTHSAHLATRRPAESPSMHMNRSELHTLLIQNSIDPLSLGPSQVTLFQSADNSQRMRLLELWRLSPPEPFSHGSQSAGDMSIDLESDLRLEETMAKIRLEQQQQEQVRSAHYVSTGSGFSGGGSSNDKMYGFRDDQQISVAVVDSSDGAEPYVKAGYDALARRDYELHANMLTESTRYNQATDPAFRGSNVVQAKTIQDMENQYGNLQAGMNHQGLDLNLHAAHEDGMMF